jgi:hypothetical protein
MQYINCERTLEIEMGSTRSHSLENLSGRCLGTFIKQITILMTDDDDDMHCHSHLKSLHKAN